MQRYAFSCFLVVFCIFLSCFFPYNANANKIYLNNDFAGNLKRHNQAIQMHEHANYLFKQSRIKEAIELQERSLKMLEPILMTNHVDMIKVVQQMIFLYKVVQNWDSAAELYNRIIKSHIRLKGKKDPYTVFLHEELGKLYMGAGQYLKAETSFLTALKIAKKIFKKKDERLAVLYSFLGGTYRKLGRFKLSEEFLRQALKIYKSDSKHYSSLIAINLNVLGIIKNAQAKHNEALELFDEASGILKQYPGKETTSLLADALNNKADVYQTLGKYDQAEQWYHDALRLHKWPEGPVSIRASSTLNNLGYLYMDKKDYRQSEYYFKESIRITGNYYGQNHPETATSINGLGLLYKQMGSYKKAAKFLSQALDIRVAAFTYNNPAVAMSLTNLGSCYAVLGDTKTAKVFFSKAIDVYNGLAPEDRKHTRHFETTVYQHLGYLYLRENQIKEAQEIFNENIRLLKKAMGADHEYTVILLMGQAAAYKKDGQYEKALRTLAKVEKKLAQIKGADHADLIFPLAQKAQIHILQRKYKTAFDDYTRLYQILRHSLDNVMAMSNERIKTDFISLFVENFQDYLNFGIQEEFLLGRKELNHLYEAWVSEKGIILESQKEMMDALVFHDNDQAKAMMKELSEIKSQIAYLFLSTNREIENQGFNRELIQSLNDKKQQMEEKLGMLSKGFAKSKKIVHPTVEEIANALPKNTVLLDYARVSKRNFKLLEGKQNADKKYVLTKDHYVVFYLKGKQPNTLEMIDLGDAKIIDDAIKSYKYHLTQRDFQRHFPLLNEAALQLYSLVFKPVQSKIERNRTVFVSPDSALNLIPFEVFMNQKNKFLIEDYTFNYLAAARDLLGFDTDETKQYHSILIGDPDFYYPGLQSKTSDKSMNNQLGMVIKSIRKDRHATGIKRLSGSRNEVLSIESILGKNQVKLYVDKNAQENVLKIGRSPKYIHFATHGFFFKNHHKIQRRDTNQDIVPVETFSEFLARDHVTFSQPLSPFLRSGLLLSGAGHTLNCGPIGPNDGILTASEILELDLSGTQMVVLSACETGIGDIANAEGVYGLNRAFFQAGAESVVMSMWKVDDQSSEKLMVDFYSQLKKEKTRCTALRKAMLNHIKTLKTENGYAHPFFWGAFVYKGKPN